MQIAPYMVALLAGLMGGAALGYALWARAAARAQAQCTAAAADLAAERARGEAHARTIERLDQAERERDQLDRAFAGAQARLAELDMVRAERDQAQIAHGASARALAAAEAGMAERERSVAEQQRQLVATGDALKAEFEQLAQAALRGTQAQFLEVAEETMKRHRAVADAGLEKSRTDLSALLTPVSDTLARYEVELKAIEASRAEGYGKLTGLLDELGKGQVASVNATARLETALRTSGKAAGRWGEEQCRNVLEMAGLVEGTDFTQQTSVDGEAGRQRPDFVLTLAGGRTLVIDVKCSVDQFIAATEAASEEERARALKAHAAAVRTHATGLASKGYEKSVPGAVDFVVLFVPGENFLAAALQHDRALMSDFMNRRIVLAGPINLIAVARTVAAMRDQARLAKEAEEMAKLGRELYDSLRIMSANLAKVQKALDTTVCTWNEFTTQLDSRVIRRARKFEALGATTGLDRIVDVGAVERTPLLPHDAEMRAGLAMLPPARAAG